MSFVDRRIKRINRQIQRSFGEVLQREADLPPDVIVTISAVDTTPNLRSSTIWLYISPLERAQEILQELKNQLYSLQGALNKKLTFHPLPRITLKIDHGSAHAQTISKRLDALDREKSNLTT